MAGNNPSLLNQAADDQLMYISLYKWTNCMWRFEN